MTGRLLVAASIVLAAFLGLTGVALDKAFRQSALGAARDRLQAEIYLLLSAAEMDGTGRLALPRDLPEARFSSPAADLYGKVTGGSGETVWRSPSALGLSIAYPRVNAAGEARFARIAASDGRPVFALSFAVDWETSGARIARYTFQVAESTAAFAEQVRRFRRNLLGWFSGAAVILVLLQALILRWGLAPLRQVARDVGEVEAGRMSALGEHYPAELRRLTTDLNAFIAHNHAQLARYRNALGDLAHSLKTPLAVLRGVCDAPAVDAQFHATLTEQIERMDRAVEFHLQRAAASGRAPMAGRIAVAPVAAKVTRSLEKVYAGRDLVFEQRIASALMFYGDEGDLTEILGNLMDNASKWALRRVLVSAGPVEVEGSARPGIALVVEDDGPGMPVGEAERLLERGARADDGPGGHGIGLALVRDIVEDLYRGTLSVGTSKLGGARIELRI